MNEELKDTLVAMYRLQLVRAMYEERMITPDNYKEYLISTASGVLDLKEESDGHSGNGEVS